VSGLAPGTEIIRFPVRGMTCGSCVNRITRAVGRLDGVERVSVDLRRETATVRRRCGGIPDDALAAAVLEAGYAAELEAAEVLPPGSDRSWLERLRGS
jgi:P-type Cu+ transporter